MRLFLRQQLSLSGLIETFKLSTPDGATPESHRFEGESLIISYGVNDRRAIEKVFKFQSIDSTYRLSEERHFYDDKLHSYNDQPSVIDFDGHIVGKIVKLSWHLDGRVARRTDKPSVVNFLNDHKGTKVVDQQWLLSDRLATRAVESKPSRMWLVGNGDVMLIHASRPLDRILIKEKDFEGFEDYSPTIFK